MLLSGQIDDDDDDDMLGACVINVEEEKYVYRVLVENPKGKRPLGRPRHRYGVNGSGFAMIFLAE